MITKPTFGMFIAILEKAYLFYISPNSFEKGGEGGGENMEANIDFHASSWKRFYTETGKIRKIHTSYGISEYCARIHEH